MVNPGWQSSNPGKVYTSRGFMVSKESDQWETPQELFDELNKEFNFDIDLCANEHNTKCEYYCTDYLAESVTITNNIGEHDLTLDFIENKVLFMNPPYSNPLPFMEKAFLDCKYNKIVCLLKVDPSTKWWAVFWDYEKHKPKLGCEVRFLSSRIKFKPPADLNPIKKGKSWYIDCQGIAHFLRVSCSICKDSGKVRCSGPGFPSCIIIMDRRPGNYYD